MSQWPNGLPGVVNEIVSALLDGDWTRFSDDSGDHFYYVIRQRDHELQENDSIDCKNLYFLGKSEAGAFEDWYVRAALAEEPADRLAKIRKRIKASGLDLALLDAVIAASRAADSQAKIRIVLDEWMPRVIAAGPDVLNSLLGLSAIMEAVRIDRTREGQTFLSNADLPAIREALEMLFLKELAERFPKVIKRAVAFDWLSFSTPQLREASRCYLYGFFGAAVLMSASVLEYRLKLVTSTDWMERYDLLVDSAFGPAGACGTDDARAFALKKLFKLRNDIAHEGVLPSQKDAEEALSVVRGTLEKIAPPEQNDW